MAGGAHAVPAFLQLHHHRLDGDYGVVHQQAEREDQRAERDALQLDPPGLHDDEHDGERERHGERHHQPGAEAERGEGDQQHHGQGGDELHQELADRFLHHMRLVGDLLQIEPQRQVGLDARGFGLQRLAEGQRIGALAHRHRDHDGTQAVVPHFGQQRLLVAGAHAGDLAQAQGAALGGHGHVQKGGHPAIGAGGEGPGGAHRHAAAGGIDDPGGGQQVLPCERGRDFLHRHAEGGEAGLVEFDEQGAGDFAEDVHLLRALHLQQPVADAFGAAHQGGVVGPREREDGAVHIGELVVGEGALHALGQVGLQVIQPLAHLVEQGGHLGRRRVVAEADHGGDEAGAAVGVEMVEIRRVLQLALDALGQELLGFCGGGARPHGGDHHQLQREGGVFAAAQAAIGKQAGDEQQRDQEARQAAMRHRPGGEIEAGHGAIPPGSRCAPSPRGRACARPAPRWSRRGPRR